MKANKAKNVTGNHSSTWQDEPIIGENGEIIGCIQAQVWDVDGNNICTLEPTRDKKIANDRADLFSEALNIAQQVNCSLTELKEQRDELFHTLEMLLEEVDSEGWSMDDGSDFEEQARSRKILERVKKTIL